MLGICVLGYNVEPCFEGAQFLTVNDMKEFKRLFKIDKQQALLSYNTINNEGETSMEEKEEKEMAPVEDFTVIRDDDIEVENFAEESEPEAQNIEVQEEVENTFSKKDEVPQEHEDAHKEIEEFQRHIAELEQTNTDFKNRIDELETKITELEQKNFSLMEYKQNIIKQEKQNIINEYKEILTEEELNSIVIDNFSVEDLNDKLAAMAYRKIANHDSANFQLINTDLDKDENDVDSIIRKYKEN